MGFQLFLLACFCLVGMVFASPRPHTGMINDEFYRNVGAVYDLSNYEGLGAFILQNKTAPECMQLYSLQVSSIQICLPDCIDCEIATGGVPVFTVGQGDVQQMPPNVTTQVGSCICRLADPATPTDTRTVRLKTTPHDPAKDLKPFMQELSNPITNACSI
ncbi:hypothetical protein BDW02DRAFT_602871 [Decorospora gaudefroyi]|uniref:Uncharacterized protein n=1 Tax=Decorospora gaudefroyi TaxID=184978 RepID=A0A6A5K6I2_9PLEO|nr:hypothetical protein BDW02DRAFT_602871 [Decorospora gaudefroyi]